jgi:hypothetical protein
MRDDCEMSGLEGDDATLQPKRMDQSVYSLEMDSKLYIDSSMGLKT